MRILMVASEAAPFIKTGGLADVLGALPPALAERGDEVAVVLPRYRRSAITGDQRMAGSISLWVGPHSYPAAFDEVVHRGARYFFLDCPPLFSREEVYGNYRDNHLRFAALCQGALWLARYVFRPDLFHTHDWQAGLTGAYLRTKFAFDPTFLGSKIVFTIHNMGYQGNFPAATFADLGLPSSAFTPAGLEFWGDVSFLKAGIIWSDAITTVSPTYAREIQTPEQGFGMDGILRTRSHRVHGILNGADYSEWNPETDRLIPANYSSADLSGKRTCKRKLLEELGLPSGEAAMRRPLLGIVSRLASQKGFDLVEEIAPWLGEQDVALAVLGSGEARYQKMFTALAALHPEKIAVRFGYDNALAHRIEAGADMFLMPSRYEPCGLNQMYSLRYGTVPIVRATGGLEDTVDAYTGFKFREYSADALRSAIELALDAYSGPEGWKDRMRRGMAKDFSWGASAAAYQQLYRAL
jgi:starch synthase